MSLECGARLRLMGGVGGWGAVGGREDAACARHREQPLRRHQGTRPTQRNGRAAWRAHVQHAARRGTGAGIVDGLGQSPAGRDHQPAAGPAFQYAAAPPINASEACAAPQETSHRKPPRPVFYG